MLEAAYNEPVGLIELTGVAIAASTPSRSQIPLEVARTLAPTTVDGDEVAFLLEGEALTALLSLSSEPILQAACDAVQSRVTDLIVPRELTASPSSLLSPANRN